MASLVIGLDFGTLSARAVLYCAKTGKQLAATEFVYPHAVMDKTLPSGMRLPPQFALQHPRDYLEALAFLPRDLLERANKTPEDIIGIGIDFTACTLLAVDAGGMPLCFDKRFANNPHAYAKLWKHHAAQAEADAITSLAKERSESWLALYGGKVSSEWALPKIAETLHKSPEVFAATDRFTEAGDWLSRILTGTETHAAAFAAYKAFWSAGNFPSADFLAALDPKLADLVGTKLCKDVTPLTERAGTLSEDGAHLTGLACGTAVALPMIDAHAAMPAIGALTAGDVAMILGTSACHLVHTAQPTPLAGICGFTESGVIPNLATYEAGQASFGDTFAWFAENCVPATYIEEAQKRSISTQALLTEKAAALRPGKSGLLALEWLGGNRSILNNSDLSGLVLGLTLQTKPEEIYLALLEGAVFGSKVILEQFATHGVPITAVRAAGGIARKNPLLMQIYADVLEKPVQVFDTTEAGALGSAMYAAVAAGIYSSVTEASRAMQASCTTTYLPIPERQQVYATLYAIYLQLHDTFGRTSDIMATLSNLRNAYS